MATVQEYEWLPSRAVLDQITSSPIKKVLGCALSGCSYELENGRAFKVTSDPKEVAAFQAVVAFRNEGTRLQGIVDIDTIPKEIAKYPWKDPERKSIYAYERELIEPLLDQDKEWQFFNLPKIKDRDTGRDTTIFHLLNEAGFDVLQANFKEGKRAQNKARKLALTTFDRLLEELDGVVRDTHPSLRSVLVTISTFRDFDLLPIDFGPNNLGFSVGGMLKIFDFGILEL